VNAYDLMLDYVRVINFRIIIICRLSSVVCRLYRECIVVKRLQIKSRIFTGKQLRVSPVSMVSLKTKFERVPSIGGFGLN